MSISTPAGHYLPGDHGRASLMRMESAAILKRFYFCEQALIRGQAAWLAAIAPLEVKLTVPRYIWEDAQVADALRQRVFELRYPSRLMEIGADAPLIQFYEASRDAPSAAAYLAGLARVLVPALLRAYQEYLAVADDIGDGPTKRFLALAAREKERQADELVALVDELVALEPDARAAANAWAGALAARADELGGVSLAPPPALGAAPPLSGAMPFAPVEVPGRDPRFHRNRFYWPDNVDPTYAYGEGIHLQLRSAVSHLNEVWAVDTAGYILDAFADQLGPDFVSDAARWVYDESRHATMGWVRLRDWGFARAELPLGSYIYDSARGQDPIYRLGMLHYFEAKNIGKKPKRAEAFAGYGDAASQHDMDFDWADEGIHAAYGKRWLTALIAARGLPPDTFEEVRARCEHLVATMVASATPDEVVDIRLTADHLIAHAGTLVTSN